MTAPWWKYGVIYQVYPRSFQDGDGDGIGDLEGIISRLDYLAWLSIDAIWISPIYPSPMADFGYDIVDYCDIDPAFGDLSCFARLLDEAHPRGLKIIMDLVPNHTSDRHPWFLDSRSYDADEVAEAESLLAMLIRLAGSKGSKQKRHLDELLDEGLQDMFPASDPVAVGHFTANEPPSRPIDSGMIDKSTSGKPRRRRRAA